MIFPLRDKVVLITGASSGIGRALAMACARRGARVGLAARSRERLLEVEKMIRDTGGEAMAVLTDVTNAGEIDRMVERTLEKWGRINALVNNAGYGVWGPFDRMPADVVRKNFETNCLAAVFCAQAVIPHLRKEGGGLIVNIESVVALRSMPYGSCYSAGKHALRAFSEAMRVELKPDRIRVLSVCPGLIDSEFHQNRVDIGQPLGRAPRWFYMPVDRCADRIIRAMESGRSRIVITGHAKLVAWTQRFAPWILDRVFASPAVQLSP